MAVKEPLFTFHVQRDSFFRFAIMIVIKIIIIIIFVVGLGLISYYYIS